MTEKLDDKLNRKDEAKFLINYLTKRYEVKEKNNENVDDEKKENSFVLNVNAKWGYGKTFFLKLLKEELKERNHEVIFFDAWKNDFTKEPLLAFFSEINDSLEKYLVSFNQQDRPFIRKIFKSSLPILVSVLTKHLAGLSADEFESLLNEEDNYEQQSNTNDSEVQKDTQRTLSSIMSKTTEIALKEHNTIKKSIKEFKENMSILLGLINDTKKELPLFILIDELDRCRPNYAIELLENIKHIFDIKGIYFIIATNSKQLSHSINAIYGANFSSEIYLKRFFDQEYSLKEPNTYEYIEFLLEKENIDQNIFCNPLLQKCYETSENLNIIAIKTYSEYFKLTLRDIEQCINLLSTITTVWSDKNEKIHIMYLLFFIMAKQKGNDFFEKYKDTINITSNEDSNEVENRITFNFSDNGNQNNSHLITNIIKVYLQAIRTNDISILKNQNNIEELITIIEQVDSNKQSIKDYYELVNSAAQLK